MKNFPSSTDRTTAVGTTGSGKTIGGMWVLSGQNFDEMPWVIVNYKNDEHLNNIEKAEEIGLSSKLPERPGIYMLRPEPDDIAGIDAWFWRVHARENIGVFCDEIFMLGQHCRGFNTLFMQGRSKHIPMIVCTQRPVLCTPFAFSEATFFMIFNLIKKVDRERIAGDVPINADYRLPLHHFYWYKVGTDRVTPMSPVPPENILLDRINSKLPNKRRFL